MLLPTVKYNIQDLCLQLGLKIMQPVPMYSNGPLTVPLEVGALEIDVLPASPCTAATTTRRTQSRTNGP